MKNIEVVNNLNKLNRFINREVELNKPLVNTIAKFKMKKNLKTLMEVYNPYSECLQDLRKQYNLEYDDKDNIINKSNDKDKQEKATAELEALFQTENEVNLNMISEKDFTEDCLLGDMILLDFMTEEADEDVSKN